LVVGFTLAIQVASLLKGRKSLSSSGRILTLNLLIAAVLTFAFPVIFLVIACNLGDCV
jgi:hypothetical protein